MNSTLLCLRCGHQWVSRKRGRPVQCPSCHSPAWDRAPNPGVDHFHNVAKALNELKGYGTFRDWVIYDAVAFTFHEEPIETYDMDVLVLVDNEDNFAYKVFPALDKVGRRVGEGAMFLVSGVPVHVLPSTGNAVLGDVVRGAVSGKIGDQPVKVASREHLILLALIRFQPGKDWGRIVQLYPTADKQRLAKLLERFDEEGTLRERLERLVPSRRS